MGDLTFHHIGLASKDPDAVVSFLYTAFEVRDDTGPVLDEGQKATVRLLTFAAGIRVEVVSGPIVDGILKRGCTYYHLCFEVNDLEASIQRLTRLGMILVSEPKPAVLFCGKRVAFLFGPFGLVELLEGECLQGCSAT